MRVQQTIHLDYVDVVALEQIAEMECCSKASLIRKFVKKGIATYVGELTEEEVDQESQRRAGLELRAKTEETRWQREVARANLEPPVQADALTDAERQYAPEAAGTREDEQDFVQRMVSRHRP
jgi:hypothetical protein